MKTCAVFVVLLLISISASRCHSEWRETEKTRNRRQAEDESNLLTKFKTLDQDDLWDFLTKSKPPDETGDDKEENTDDLFGGDYEENDLFKFESEETPLSPPTLATAGSPTPEKQSETTLTTRSTTTPSVTVSSTSTEITETTTVQTEEKVSKASPNNESIPNVTPSTASSSSTETPETTTMKTEPALGPTLSTPSTTEKTEATEISTTLIFPGETTPNSEPSVPTQTITEPKIEDSTKTTSIISSSVNETSPTTVTSSSKQATTTTESSSTISATVSESSATTESRQSTQDPAPTETTSTNPSSVSETITTTVTIPKRNIENTKATSTTPSTARENIATTVPTPTSETTTEINEAASEITTEFNEAAPTTTVNKTVATTVPTETPRTTTEKSEASSSTASVISATAAPTEASVSMQTTTVAKPGATTLPSSSTVPNETTATTVPSTQITTENTKETSTIPSTTSENVATTVATVLTPTPETSTEIIEAATATTPTTARVPTETPKTTIDKTEATSSTTSFVSATADPTEASVSTQTTTVKKIEATTLPSSLTVPNETTATTVPSTKITSENTKETSTIPSTTSENVATIVPTVLTPTPETTKEINEAALATTPTTARVPTETPKTTTETSEDASSTTSFVSATVATTVPSVSTQTTTVAKTEATTLPSSLTVPNETTATTVPSTKITTENTKETSTIPSTTSENVATTVATVLTLTPETISEIIEAASATTPTTARVPTETPKTSTETSEDASSTTSFVSATVATTVASVSTQTTTVAKTEATTLPSSLTVPNETTATTVPSTKITTENTKETSTIPSTTSENVATILTPTPETTTEIIEAASATTPTTARVPTETPKTTTEKSEATSSTTSFVSATVATTVASVSTQMTTVAKTEAITPPTIPSVPNETTVTTVVTTIATTENTNETFTIPSTTRKTIATTVSTPGTTTEKGAAWTTILTTGSEPVADLMTTQPTTTAKTGATTLEGSSASSPITNGTITVPTTTTQTPKSATEKTEETSKSTSTTPSTSETTTTAARSTTRLIEETTGAKSETTTSKSGTTISTSKETSTTGIPIIATQQTMETTTTKTLKQNEISGITGSQKQGGTTTLQPDCLVSDKLCPSRTFAISDEEIEEEIVGPIQRPNLLPKHKLLPNKTFTIGDEVLPIPPPLPPKPSFDHLNNWKPITRPTPDPDLRPKFGFLSPERMYTIPDDVKTTQKPATTIRPNVGMPNRRIFVIPVNRNIFPATGMSIHPSNYPSATRPNWNFIIGLRNRTENPFPDVRVMLNDEEYQSDSAEDSGGATLAFVFDSTGSMRDDLKQAKEGAAKITATMLAHPDKPIYDYVLVPFHDPEIGPVTQTTNHILFQERLASIDVHGGRDCPEMSVGGILRALEVSRPNSYIYVFTDASAKDYYLASQVLSLIQRKQSQVVFLLTGNCNGVNDPGYKVYESIAATSSGQVYDLNKTDVEEVLKFVRISLQHQKQKVNLLSVDSPTPAKEGKQLPLQIDDSLKEFTVSVSGTNSKLKVTNPEGQQAVPPQLTPLLDLVNVKVINVKEPDPGLWTLTIGSDSPHSVRSTGLSTSNFIHGFSVIPTINIAETAHRPLQSTENSLLIKATEPENIFNLTQVKLIGFSGNLLATIILQPVQGRHGLFIGGPLIPPNDFFNMEINGYGKDGIPIRRITPSAITSQPPDLPIINLKKQFTTWTGKSYKIRCNVESLVPVTVTWFKSGSIKGKTLRFKQTADAILEFNQISVDDEGTYVCKANNVAGTTTAETYITVTGPPPTVDMPPEIISEPGAALTIPCNVSSILTYNITWAKAESPHENFDPRTVKTLSYSSHVQFRGTSLHIPKLSFWDKGWYICTASNLGGRGRGKSYVTIGKSPSIEVSPIGLKFQSGSTFTISCKATGGIPETALSWTKDRIPINNYRGKYSVRYLGTDTLEVTVRNAKREDEGVYECYGSNSISTVSEKLQIKYIEVPKILQPEERHLIVRVGQNIRIKCNVTAGVPQSIIEWLKMSSQNQFRDQAIQSNEDGSLEIKSAQISDTGQYVCLAKNEAGEDQSIISVLVGTPPEIIQPPVDTSIEIGSSGRLFCIATGNPPPSITWLYRDKEISNAKNKTSFLITEASIDNNGTYYCIAENPFGKRENQAEVAIIGIVPPKINSDGFPDVIKGLVGEKIELVCPVLAGNPYPTVKWFKDGTSLDNSYNKKYLMNNGSFIIPVMTHQHVGSYECVLQNVAGTDKTNTTLKMLEAPRIDLNVESYIVVIAGENVSLPCRVSGDPPIEITWNKLLHGVQKNHRGYRKKDSDNLFIDNVDEEDTGRYVCKAENPAGIARRAIALSVIVPPKILNWSDSITVISGSVVSISCNTRAVPRAKITWKKDNSSLPPDKRSYGAFLRFYAQSSDSGIYSCIAENKAGKSVEHLNLTVLYPPRIDTTVPSEISAILGDQVILKCGLISGVPKPSIIWEHKGNVIQNGILESDYLITNIGINDAGNYTCVASNDAGTERRSVEVTVMTPPQIKQWLQPLKVVQGEKVNITCEVNSSPQAFVKWFKKNTTVPEKYVTENNLRFTAEPLDSGTYTCVAINEAGSDSKDIVVIVLEPPKFYSNLPGSIDFIKGRTIQIDCQAEGDPPPIMSWYKEGSYLSPDDQYKEVFENGSLFVYDAKVEDGGQYECIATNVAGSNRKYINVNILVPPQMVPWPETIYVNQGQTVTMLCEGEGEPPLSYSWLKNNQSLPSYLMPQGNKLRFLALKRDSGSYSCTGVNKAGNKTLSTQLIVKVAPSIIPPSEEQVLVLVGQQIKLECRVEGIPEPTLSWYYNNSKLDENFTQIQSIGNELNIVRTTLNLTGTYVCEANNSAGMAQKVFKLLIHALPKILDNTTENVILKEGDDYSIPCTVFGIPHPNVSWVRGQQVFHPGHHDDEILITQENALVISNAVQSTSGIYSCVAVNIEGFASRNYSVDVLVPPKTMESGIVKVEVREAETGILTCPAASGLPAPGIKWVKDGQDLGSIPKERADEAHFDLTEGGRTLKITEAFPSDSGRYTCFVSNLVGNASSTFVVDVLVKAHLEEEFPQLDYSILENTNLTIDCSANGNPKPKVHWRKLENNIPITQHTLPGTMVKGDHKQHLMITFAKKHHNGSYICTAKNEIGREHRTFNVEVIEIPKLEGNEEEIIEALKGKTVSLECSMSGNPQLQYTWEHYENNRKHKQLNLTEKNLVIKTVNSENSGTYICTGYNKAGNKSKSFSVTLLDPPEIILLQEPNLIKIFEGQDTTLECLVKGSPAPTVSWLKNGHIINRSDLIISDSLPSSNVQNHTLKITDSSRSDSGKYTCVASNNGGTAEKSFTVLFVAPPKILRERSPNHNKIEIVKGLPLFIKCPIGGDSEFSIKWIKNESPIESDNVKGFSNNEVFIPQSKTEDAGNYTCVATNEAGDVTLSFSVDILVPPSMANDSTEYMKITVDDELAMKCLASGKPEPSILWTKDHMPLNHHLENITLADSNQTLIIDPVQTGDAGKYTCFANSIAGTAEKSFLIDVFEAPKEIEGRSSSSRKNITVKLNKRTVLKCPLTGTPQPKITWKKGQIIIDNYNSTMVQISADRKQMHIMHASETDGGLYQCIAENEAGTSEVTFHVIVIVPLDWSPWSEWEECTQSCGGGVQKRSRHCGHGRDLIKSVYIKFDNSSCQENAFQIQRCNTHSCPIAGGWGEWDQWSACSLTCGVGMRKRKRACNKPVPQFGGPSCFGTSEEDSLCNIQECPVNGGWSEWSDWSECTVSCGSGVKLRERKCNNPAPTIGGDTCKGERRDVALCNVDRCQEWGQWSGWGEWSECSVSCGIGGQSRTRQCLQSLYRRAPCKGDNMQFRKCYTPPCIDTATIARLPQTAALRINGEINGHMLRDQEVSAVITEEDLETVLTATVENNEKKQHSRSVPTYLPFILPSVTWSTAHEKQAANNGYSLTRGKFNQESNFKFSTGDELRIRTKGKGIKNDGSLDVDIEVFGKIPKTQPEAVITIIPYEEDVVQTGPNSLYSEANTGVKVDGQVLPLTWNSTVNYNHQGKMPFLAEKVLTNKIKSSYNKSNNQVKYSVASAISQKFKENKCPVGFRHNRKHGHCQDVDECKHRRRNNCYNNQICENTFGSYKCLCRHGFRLASDGKKCVDIDECVEQQPCSHLCYNTRGSYDCECPEGLVLSDDKHTCIAEDMWDYNSDNYQDYVETYSSGEDDIWNKSEMHKITENSNNWKVDNFSILEHKRPAEEWVCQPGFSKVEDQCKDINECTRDRDICTPEQMCFNTKGSFKCIEVPCPEEFDLQPNTRSCVKSCVESWSKCMEGATVTESFHYVPVPVEVNRLIPYQDIIKLTPYDENGRALPGAIYEVIKNDSGIPLRIRIDKGFGVVYVMKNFKLQQVEKVSVLARVYDEDDKIVYAAHFVLFIYNNDLT